MPAQPSSAEFTVSTNVLQPGDNISVGAQEDGRFLVAWTYAPPEPDEPDGEDVNRTDVLARGYDGSTALADEFRVNTSQYGEQGDPQVVGRPNGSYVVAYDGDTAPSFEFSRTISQVVEGDGTLIGPEARAEDFDVSHGDTDVAAFEDDSFVTVAATTGNANVIHGQRHAADGAITDEFTFGYSDSGREAAVASTVGDEFLALWIGFLSEPDDIETADSTTLYGQRGNAAGLAGGPFVISDTVADEPSARRLRQGDESNLAVVWQDTSGEIVATVIGSNGSVIVPAFAVSGTGAGRPELAALDSGNFVVVWQEAGGDASGSAILGRLFRPDGSAIGDAFLVNEAVAGDQREPAVASTGDGEFVVTWVGPDGVKARLFTTESVAAPETPLFTRPGTIDLSPAEDQTVGSGAGASSFYVALDATSGQDRILDFETHDVLLTQGRLFDGNGDGLVSFGRDGLLNPDGPGIGDDAIALDGVTALRFLGDTGGVAVYADAGTRPGNAVESRLGDDVLRGDAADTRSDAFFFDTALGAALGDDDIQSFGERDILVSTTRLADRDGDGRIGFGDDMLLNIGDGTVDIRSLSGSRITQLEFDGDVERDGVSYFVYSLTGSAAGLADLLWG